MNSYFKVNKDTQLEVLTVGNEETPVMIIDDFALSTVDIINEACQNSDFQQDKDSYYPGLRSILPFQYTVDVLQPIFNAIRKLYNIPTNLKLVPQTSCFSLITKKEEDLEFLQSLPHFDTSRPYYFAILHYLNEAEHGDTGLFRHIDTGFEKIDEHRVERYLTSANDSMKNVEPAKASYISDSTEQYELYHTISYKPNRLVIYPGNLLHSTLVSPETDIDSNPRTGRLTANVFIEFT